MTDAFEWTSEPVTVVGACGSETRQLTVGVGGLDSGQLRVVIGIHDECDYASILLSREELRALIDALTSTLDESTPAAPEPTSKELAREVAALVDRYYSTARTDSDQAAIVNLAGLLRHATAYTAALTTEIAHYASDAAEARDEADEANRAYGELAEENGGLRLRVEELEAALTVAAGERDTLRAAQAVQR